ncbi:hypothetical protein PANT_9d00197 [Moesziomyces antarcticus T-34]|uniref:Uncharacterized protein n=1 Tax=Pseudozyma antarctica (strain T-34) TaxID=1151754 RepID=M9MCM1_PSEA3|nr:hypothetical protein PANT_9d00197 [Moesziomyces antarcticus T-34]
MASSPLLTLRYASLEDVAQDLDMVIQSSSTDQWSWQGVNADEEQAWSRFVQDPSSVPAEEAASAIAGMSGKIQVTQDVALSFALLSRHGGLDGSPIDAVVDMSAPTISSQGVATIKEALVGRSHAWDDDGVESLFLFDLLTTAQEQVASADLAPSAESGGREQGLESVPNTKQSDSTTSVEMSRALFWSHHLKAPSKLKDFNNWCPELRIWGIVRTGYPGYLCFEGEATAVAEMVRRVKALQWHAIQLRVNESWTWHPSSSGDAANLAPLEQALLSCALAQDHPANTEVGKVRTGCQVLESLGELVQRLRECGLPHDEISDALGIRISTAQASDS